MKENGRGTLLQRPHSPMAVFLCRIIAARATRPTAGCIVHSPPDIMPAPTAPPTTTNPAHPITYTASAPALPPTVTPTTRSHACPHAPHTAASARPAADDDFSASTSANPTPPAPLPRLPLCPATPRAEVALLSLGPWFHRPAACQLACRACERRGTESATKRGAATVATSSGVPSAESPSSLPHKERVWAKTARETAERR